MTSRLRRFWTAFAIVAQILLMRGFALLFVSESITWRVPMGLFHALAGFGFIVFWATVDIQEFPRRVAGVMRSAVILMPSAFVLFGGVMLILENFETSATLLPFVQFLAAASFLAGICFWVLFFALSHRSDGSDSDSV